MIAEQFGVGGLISTVSTACSSSLNSIMFGSRLIKSGKTKKAIVGGTDSLSKFTLNGFNTLMILDKGHCRPFDISRTGLNLGEGAAYLILEEKESALKARKTIYAEITAYSNANDAHHQTASSDNGEGPYLAMKKAIDMAGLNVDDISYINAHGTGTDNNDLTESIAIKRLFGDNYPPFSSTKAYTGHTLGAAGVIETVFSILAMQNKLAFPNINFKNSIKETNLIPVKELLKLENCKHVITNSFGFGGNDSSLIISKLNDDITAQLPIKNDTKIYINAAASVSPQQSLGKVNFDEEVEEIESNYLEIKKPNYREFIDPKVLRRMSKIVRMGIVASKTALKQVNINRPDAIITATGMGCQADTEKFLNAMLENNEGLLTPTSFIQSTHNTVGGAVALGQKNHNYNLTYVHRTFSFETALTDTAMLLKETNAENILLGGFDEVTQESWLIKTKIDYFKAEACSNINLLNDNQKGGLAGEGSSFFVVSNNANENTLCEFLDTSMFFRPDNNEVIINKISSFLKKNKLNTDDIDLVIMGHNGDREFDAIYDDVERSLFTKTNIAYHKHLCGEYDTSSAFATFLASGIIKENKLNKALLKKEIPNRNEYKKVLIYNQFRNINHSLILLSK